MYTIGLDVGSISTKAALFDGKDYRYVVMPTGFSPKEAGNLAIDNLLAQGQIDRSLVKAIVGTGYGRVHMPYADKIVNELTCHGRGASFLFPQARGVIDIGGQDSKVMVLDEVGKIVDFLLNDKCAAGTGRFLQVTAHALGVELTEIDEITEGQEPVDIGSMCAVFAETEVLNLIVAGHDRGNVLAGVLKSIAVRMAAMSGRILDAVGADPNNQIVFTGGLAKSKNLRRLLESESGWIIQKPAEPQVIGALGAAVIAYEWRRVTAFMYQGLGKWNTD